MRGRVVGADHRLGTPQIPEGVGQRERLLAGVVGLIERPGLRVLARCGVRAQRRGAAERGHRGRQGGGGVLPDLVRAHGRGRASLDEAGFVGRQVDLMQGLVGDLGVRAHVLAVVDREVLHLRHGAGALNAIDLRRYRLPAQVRVLARGGEIPAPVRQPVDIGLRPEQAGHHQLAGLGALGLAPDVGQPEVERGRQVHQRRRTSGHLRIRALEGVDALGIGPARRHDARVRAGRGGGGPDVVASCVRSAVEQGAGVGQLRLGWRVVGLELGDDVEHRGRVRCIRGDGGRDRGPGEPDGQRVRNIRRGRGTDEVIRRHGHRGA